MKYLVRILSPVVLTALTASGSDRSPTTPPEEPRGPSINFESTTFDFGKINTGESVTHAFVFTNTGNQVLEILRVQPGCGCTTAGAWDKRVEPGAKGSIPLRFNSGGFSGRVSKSATVHCNDLSHSNVVLQLTGTIWKPIDTMPSLAMFAFSEDGQVPQSKSVRIVNNLEEMVQLSDLVCTNTSFKVALETVTPGREFALNITAIPPFPPGSTVAQIQLSTSSTKTPSLQVTAYAVVQPAVTISPEQIWIPGDALTSPLKSTVVIRNSSAETFSLSEVKASVPGLDVQVRETEKGRVFHLDLTFPIGFRLESGQAAQISAKSSLPRFPMLRIPVIQQPGSRTLTSKATTQ